MAKRRAPTKSVERDVLKACRRRCCLCYFLSDVDREQKGQIAHLNRDPSDSRFENLVFLCLEHHDDYDGRTSQSKAYSVEEVRSYRDDLYLKNPHYKETAKNVLNGPPIIIDSEKDDLSQYERIRKRNPDKYDYHDRRWRFPLWQVANEPEFFAFKAGNGCDGVCVIERIDLPDQRIVIVCTQVPGNPGNSITNCVEELCFQVCERFEVSSDRLVWIERYEYDDEWRMVTFDEPNGAEIFKNPVWTVMTRKMWNDLKLLPKNRLGHSFLGLESNIKKLFDWPTRNLID